MFLLVEKVKFETDARKICHITNASSCIARKLFQISNVNCTNAATSKFHGPRVLCDY